ncbi:protein-disulfide reductase DsbD domain-containing protein [Pseudovibrio flavus]|uniref:protein-disulfide reductase DsbD domain-containing protein n=1 Tax=Pseudovibrio flavus TaxID=2529854 RepID=UPI00211BDE33|nr:protein-disulfide reductase DsbD domain-containing protein [Pseudovibrio flavus]
MINPLKTALFAIIALPLATQAQAVETFGTDWTPIEGGQVRLVRASAPEADGSYLAAFQFELKPGWHMYWRYPGEAGVPTEVDFSSSTNLTDAQLMFPAPQEYFDGFSRSIVYKDKVTLPVRIERKSDKRPAVVVAKMDFGICEKVCVPVSTELSTTLPSAGKKDTASDALFYDALKSIPQAHEAGDNQITVSLSKNGKEPVLEFTSKVQEGDTDPALFVEGPPMSYHGVPKLKGVKGDVATWQLPMNGLAHEGNTLDLVMTLVSGQRTFEETQEITLPKGFAEAL